LASVVLVAALATLLSLPDPAKSLPTSSDVLALTRGEEKFVYVADRENGQVLVFASSRLERPHAVVPIGSQGNQPGSGKPESMIALRRGSMHLVFVTDTAGNAVRIIDVNNNTPLAKSLSVGRAPRALAITPDHRKLFVSNEQPAPNGTITVLDVSGDTPQDFHEVSTIDEVNCPEGLALSPRGDRLYVATQCGGGSDPVFIIDTATNQKVGEIPQLAVGTNLAVSADGRHLYVTRGNFRCRKRDGSENGSPLSIVNLQDRTSKSVCLRTSVGAIAVSRDVAARYVFVANGNALTVFDREKLDRDRNKDIDPGAVQLNDIPLEAPVTGIGVAEDNSVYAYLPQSRRIFIYSPTGLKSD
jgi:DNA-binding beta-propeller fold protein YncE